MIGINLLHHFNTDRLDNPPRPRLEINRLDALSTAMVITTPLTEVVLVLVRLVDKIPVAPHAVLAASAAPAQLKTVTARAFDDE